MNKSEEERKMTDTVETNPEDVAVSIWPTIWKFSLIITACTFAYSLVLYYTGLAGSSGLNLVATVIFIVLLVVGMKKYRSLNGGYMTFGTGAVIGIMTAVIQTILNAGLNALYLGLVDRTILPALKDKTLQQIQSAPGMNQQALDMMTKFYDVLFTPAGMFIIGCITGIIGGIVIALIVAAIMKKSPPVDA